MALTIIVTDAGRAALVNAANNGTNPVVITQAGISATAVVPSKTATALPGEIKRLSTISGDVVADDMIHLIVRDEGGDTFTVRSFGLYLGNGTLFAIYGQANPILEKSAQAMMLLAIDIAFADVDAAQISFGDANFLLPPATEAMQGVVELATEAEATAGTDMQRAVHPKGLKGAVTSWLNARLGDGNPSTFMKSLLATASAAALRAALGIKSGALKDEGAGGGLDADKLDGEHGAYYADVSARLGYTPANKAGETFTGSVTAPSITISTGDLHLSRQTNAWGYITRPSAAGYRNLAFTTVGDTAPLDHVTFNAALITRAGSKIWDAGNDGAGSGLDADMVDGLQASSFMRRTNDVWLTSEDGKNRFFFAANESSYAGVVGWFRFQNQQAINVVTIDETGSLTTLGGVQATNPNGAYSQLSHDGDLRTNRVGGASGAIFFGMQGAYIHWEGANWHIQGTAGAQGYINGGLVWTANNDGSGSGLDADMVDGWHAGNLDPIIDQNLGPSGFKSYASGFKECWTTVYIGADSGTTWYLPIVHRDWVNPTISLSIQWGENNAQQQVGVTSVGLDHVQIYSAVNYPVTVRIHTKGV